MQAENQLNDEHLETVSGGFGDGLSRITPQQAKAIAANYLREDGFYVGVVFFDGQYYNAPVYDLDGLERYIILVDPYTGEII